MLSCAGSIQSSDRSRPTEFIPIADTTGLIRPIGPGCSTSPGRHIALWRAGPGFRRTCGWRSTCPLANSPNQLCRPVHRPSNGGVPVSRFTWNHRERAHGPRRQRDGHDPRLQPSGVSRAGRLRTGYSFAQLPQPTSRRHDQDRPVVRQGLTGGAGHDTRLFESIVALADVLALKVVAEGSLNAEHSSLLRDLGAPTGRAGCGVGRSHHRTSSTDGRTRPPTAASRHEQPATEGSPSRVSGQRDRIRRVRRHPPIDAAVRVVRHVSCRDRAGRWCRCRSLHREKPSHHQSV